MHSRTSCRGCRDTARAGKQKGAAAPLVQPSFPLLNLCVLAEILDERLHALLQTFPNLRSHLFQRRKLSVAHVIEPNDVPAELSLHWCIGD